MALHFCNCTKLTGFLYLVIFLFFNNTAKAQPGYLDSSFGNNGKMIFNDAQFTFPEKILTSLNGDFYMVSVQGVYGNRVTILSKFFNDGSIDASYGVNGVSNPINISPTETIIQPDGKIIIAGNTDAYFDIYHRPFATIARVDSNGSPDSSYGVNGYITWYYNLANGVEDLISASMEQDKVIVSVLTRSSVGPKIVQFFISSISPDGSIERSLLTPTPATTMWLNG